MCTWLQHCIGMSDSSDPCVFLLGGVERAKIRQHLKLRPPPPCSGLHHYAQASTIMLRPQPPCSGHHYHAPAFITMLLPPSPYSILRHHAPASTTMVRPLPPWSGLLPRHCQASRMAWKGHSKKFSTFASCVPDTTSAAKMLMLRGRDEVRQWNEV